MRTQQPLAIISGAGAGLGRSLLQRFENGGYKCVGFGRSEPEHQIADFYKVDMADPVAVNDAIGDVINKYGPPKVAVHNTAELIIAPFEETTLEDFQRTWRSMVQSAVVLSNATIPAMVKNGGGAFLATGATASIRGGAKFAAFASAKFALRGLTQSLAREYQKDGVHVCHVLLDGIIDTPRSRELHGLDTERMMQPNDIADAYWQLAHQPKSTWTHELDLRPASEQF